MNRVSNLSQPPSSSVAERICRIAPIAELVVAAMLGAGPMTFEGLGYHLAYGERRNGGHQ